MNLILTLLLSLASGFISTEAILRSLIPRLKSAGIVGKDVHKPEKPEIAERGGFAVVFGLIISQLLTSLLIEEVRAHSITLLCSTLIAAVVGSLDDLIDLGGRAKPALSMLSGLPLVASGLLSPRPIIPLIGRTRLHYIYPLAALLLPGIFSNAINMIDALNGMMASNSIIILFFMALISVLSSSKIGLLLSVSSMGPILAFYAENKYPARVFSGNVGSLSIGACLASIALLGRIEAPFAIACTPLLLTGFMILASVGGLKEKKEMMMRPVVVQEGIIRANPSPDAPITLVSLLTLERGKREPRIVLESNLLFILSGLLATITYLELTPR